MQQYLPGKIDHKYKEADLPGYLLPYHEPSPATLIAISFSVSLPGQLRIYGDEVLLMQVWTNLLSNAVNHIPKGRSIHVAAEELDRVCISFVSWNSLMPNK
jgi:signal transduction histidine kinase